MNLSTTSTDNITELLSHIVEFTQRRRAVIMDNIIDCDHEDFTPKDLDVDGFADIMLFAVAQHVQHDRILLKDSDTIRFGSNGFFQSNTVVDHRAKELFKSDRREYIELQVSKFAENTLNSKVAKLLIENVI